MNVANRTNRNTSTNVSPTPATAKDGHKKGLFVRSLIAVALAEAIMIGSAFAADAKAPTPASYDIAASDDDTSSDKSSTDTRTPMFAMGTVSGGSIGTMAAPAPWMSIDGVQNDNLGSLNGADSSKTALAMGSGSTASGANTAAIGVGTFAGSDYSVAMGSSATTGADQPYSVAVGSNVSTTGEQATALGSNTIANADNALAVGSNTQAIGTSSTAIGYGAKVNSGADNSIAMGTSAKVAGGVTDAMALGPNSSVVAGAYGSVALGAGSIANLANVVSVGAVGAERQIVNVAAGTRPTDAVNFSQLTDLQSQVTNIDNRVVTIETGTGTGPGPAPGNGGGNGGQWNYDAQGNKIVNVGDGAVNPGSKDAVNGSQLANTAQSTADALGGGSTVNTDGSITVPTYNVGGKQVSGVEGAVNQLDQRMNGMQGQIDGMQGQLNKTTRGAYSGIAGVTALTMIPGVDMGKTLSIGAGVGNYKGYTAAALGGEARINENWKVRAGVSLSSSGNTVGVGASYQW